MPRKAVEDLTDEDIEVRLTKPQLKSLIRKLDPYFKVSGSAAQLRALLRRERDRALELQELRISQPQREPQPASSSPLPSRVAALDIDGDSNSANNNSGIFNMGSIGSNGFNPAIEQPPRKKARLSNSEYDDDKSSAERTPRGD